VTPGHLVAEFHSCLETERVASRPVGRFPVRRWCSGSRSNHDPAGRPDSNVYRPNYVNQQIAQNVLTLRETHQSPTAGPGDPGWQSEVVTQNVRVQVQRIASEVVTSKRPRPTHSHCVPETSLRKIPVPRGFQRTGNANVDSQSPVQHRQLGSPRNRSQVSPSSRLPRDSTKNRKERAR